MMMVHEFRIAIPVVALLALAGCDEKSKGYVEHCDGPTCFTPPPDECVDGSTIREFSSPGDCVDGVCVYPSEESTCEFGCSEGACLPDPDLADQCFRTYENYPVPNLLIPEDGDEAASACVTVSVPDSCIVGELAVQVGVDHVNAENLAFMLHSPSGTRTAIMHRPDHPVSVTGGSPRFVSTYPVVFDDTAEHDAENLGAEMGMSGVVCQDDDICTYSPSPGTLAAFHGEQAAGDWNLCVHDYGDGAHGSVDHVELHFHSHDGPAGDPVSGLDITKISLWQAVEIPLMDGGTAVPRGDRPVPVIEGKDGLMRIHVRMQSGWTARPVKAVVQLQGSSIGSPVIIGRSFVQVDSRLASMASTINVFVPGRYVVGDLEYSVQLVEDGGSGSGTTDGSRWPATGTAELDPANDYGPLRVVLIPVRYNADGTGRLPDTSPGTVQMYRDYLYAQYPHAQIEITVGEPTDYPYVVSGGSMGNWSTLLGHVTEVREERDAAFDEYYYGLINPAEYFNAYCPDGCTLGMSHVADSPDNAGMRASVGVGFVRSGSAETMVHDIGHAHGREHAPCEAPGPDPEFPYTGGGIGTWGLDVVYSGVKDPSRTFDFMSYCEPTWVSDYTYNALYMRALGVSTSGDVWYPPDHVFHAWASVGVVYPDMVFEGPTFDDDSATKGGRPTDVVLLDASGAEIATITGYLTPTSGGVGGFIVYPEPGPDVAAVLVPGIGTLDLSE